MMCMTTMERFRRDLEARGLRPNTVEAYVRCVRRFVDQLGRPPSRAREQDVRDYLVRLRERYCARSINQTIAALRAFYEGTLRRADAVARLRQMRVEQSLPTILSGSEVERLLAATRSPKHRALLALLYGAGLRVSEACALTIEDIDSGRMLLRIRHAKGQPRYVELSPRILQALRAYYRAERPPGPLLFPGRGTGRPLTRAAVSKALQQIVESLQLNKRVTPHTFRHCYATHHLDAGADLRTVQMLLGHAHISSTQHYTRLSRARLAATPSPIELLGTQAGQVLG